MNAVAELLKLALVLITKSFQHNFYLSFLSHTAFYRDHRTLGGVGQLKAATASCLGRLAWKDLQLVGHTAPALAPAPRAIHVVLKVAALARAAAASMGSQGSGESPWCAGTSRSLVQTRAAAWPPSTRMAV